MSDPGEHKLVALPQADPRAKTLSGKCKAADCGKRYNATGEDDLARQHEAHLAEVRGDKHPQEIDPDSSEATGLAETIDPPTSADALGESYGNEREGTEG